PLVLPPGAARPPRSPPSAAADRERPRRLAVRAGGARCRFPPQERLVPRRRLLPEPPRRGRRRARDADVPAGALPLLDRLSVLPPEGRRRPLPLVRPPRRRAREREGRQRCTAVRDLTELVAADLDEPLVADPEVVGEFVAHHTAHVAPQRDGIVAPVPPEGPAVDRHRVRLRPRHEDALGWKRDASVHRQPPL